MEAISGEPGAEALDVSDLICRLLLQNESLLKHSERIPELFEQSLEFKVHEKDINKFGKVPSLTACMYQNDVYQIWLASPKGK